MPLTRARREMSFNPRKRKPRDTRVPVSNASVRFKQVSEVANSITAEEAENGDWITEHDTTGEAKTGRAATHVFSIPELLENILKRVPQIDIFILQRVSRAFNSTIQGSKALQRKMLAAPKWEPTTESDGEVVLSRFVDDHGPGYFQIEPFSGPYLDRKMRLDRKILHCYLVADKGQPMGWQGKRAIYTTGSWGKLELGLPACVVRVSAYGKEAKAVEHLAAGSTVADLFGFLGKCREEAAAKAARYRERQERQRKAFAEEVCVARGLR